MSEVGTKPRIDLQLLGSRPSKLSKPVKIVPMPFFTKPHMTTMWPFAFCYAYVLFKFYELFELPALSEKDVQESKWLAYLYTRGIPHPLIPKELTQARREELARRKAQKH